MTQTEPDPTIQQVPRPGAGPRPGAERRQPVQVALPAVPTIGLVDDLDPALRQWLVDYLTEARRAAGAVLGSGAARRDIDLLALRLAIATLREA